MYVVRECQTAARSPNEQGPSSPPQGGSRRHLRTSGREGSDMLYYIYNSKYRRYYKHRMNTRGSHPPREGVCLNKHNRAIIIIIMMCMCMCVCMCMCMCARICVRVCVYVYVYIIYIYIYVCLTALLVGRA